MRFTMKPFLIAICVLLLAGCAGGPTKDYYNPAVTGAKHSGPIVITRVDSVAAERASRERAGYTVLGTTDYGGKYPEAVELKAQARRVGASHVIYSADWVPAPPGSWSFGFGRFGGGGGSGGGHNDVHIVFLHASTNSLPTQR